MVNAFEGNKAETATMLPVLRSFQAAHGITGVTVVADAGMLSRGNQIAVGQAGLSFILGARLPSVPYVIAQWHRDHPDAEQVPDGLVLTQSMPAAPSDGRGHWWVYYRYAHDRGRRTQHYFQDFYNYAGLIRSVHLCATSTTHLDDLVVRTDRDGTDGIVEYSCEMAGGSGVGVDVVVEVTLADASGTVVATAEVAEQIPARTLRTLRLFGVSRCLRLETS